MGVSTSTSGSERVTGIRGDGASSPSEMTTDWTDALCKLMEKESIVHRDRENKGFFYQKKVKGIFFRAPDAITIADFM